jgi:hypothetical protein
MGLDFIRRTTDTFRRKWDRSKERFKIEDIFCLPPEKLRLITINPVCPAAFGAGKKYELAANSKQIDVYLDRELIGVCLAPPASIVDDLVQVGGIAEGIFWGQREYSGLIDLAVCLYTDSN